MNDEVKVNAIIAKTSRKKLGERLEITYPTLKSRINKGNWSNKEREIINEFFKELYDE